MNASSPAMGDIDGDNRDEAVFTVKNVLHALGSNAAGNAVKLRFSAKVDNNEYDRQLGDAIIADVDGGGAMQIVVNTSDGFILGLGESSE